MTHNYSLIVTFVYVFTMYSAPGIPAPIAVSLVFPPISADPLPLPIQVPLCFHAFPYFFFKVYKFHSGFYRIMVEGLFTET